MTCTFLTGRNRRAKIVGCSVRVWEVRGACSLSLFYSSRWKTKGFGFRGLSESASEGISAQMCCENEAREMLQGPRRERKSSRLSCLRANQSFLSGCETGHFNIDSSEMERSVTWCFVFISPEYTDKKSWRWQFGNPIKDKDVYTIAGSNKHPQATSHNLTALSVEPST